MRIARRTLLAAAPGMLAARATRSATLDVAVVGAGLAGIAAARRLHALGRTCIVLEREDRVGGRAWTDTATLRLPVDRGAQWLHSADRNPLTPLARHYGFTVEPDDGPERLVLGGRSATPEETEAVAEAEARLAARLDELAAADITAAAATGTSAADRIAARLALAFGHGAEPDRLSTADLAAQVATGDERLVRPGFGTFARLLAQDLPIRLGFTVRTVDLGGPGVRLSGPGGTLAARAAIVTVSTGVLASGGLVVTPRLPDAHAQAVHDLPMGLVDKVVLRLREGALAEVAAFTSVRGSGADGSAFDLLLRPFGEDLAYLHVGGDLARALQAAGSEAAFAYARARLSEAAGADALRRIKGGLVTTWAAEPWALGSYTHALPGRAAARRTLAQPVADRLFLAGEATSAAWAGQAAGAWISGDRAARAAHLALGGITASAASP